MKILDSRMRVIKIFQAAMDEAPISNQKQYDKAVEEYKRIHPPKYWFHRMHEFFLRLLTPPPSLRHQLMASGWTIGADGLLSYQHQTEWCVFNSMGTEPIHIVKFYLRGDTVQSELQ